MHIYIYIKLDYLHVYRKRQVRSISVIIGFVRCRQRHFNHPSPPLQSVFWYKSYVKKGKVQTMIFLKTVLKKHFGYY